MILTSLHILTAIALIVLVLLQERSSGISAIFGGDMGGIYQTRRGVEKIIFTSTIVLAACFIGLSVLQLIFAA